jgi:hypothetical protein
VYPSKSVPMTEGFHLPVTGMFPTRDGRVIPAPLILLSNANELG